MKPRILALLLALLLLCGCAAPQKAPAGQPAPEQPAPEQPAAQISRVKSNLSRLLFTLASYFLVLA